MYIAIFSNQIVVRVNILFVLVYTNQANNDKTCNAQKYFLP